MRHRRHITLLVTLCASLCLVASTAAPAPAEAPPVPPQAAQDAAQAFFNALARGDGADACQMMTDQLKGQLYDQHTIPCATAFTYTPWSRSDKLMRADLYKAYRGARQQAYENLPEGTFLGDWRKERRIIADYMGTVDVYPSGRDECVARRHVESICFEVSPDRTKLTLWAQSKEHALWRLRATSNWRVRPDSYLIKRGTYVPPPPQLSLTATPGPNYGTTPPKDPNDMTVHVLAVSKIGFRHYDQYISADLQYIDGKWWMVTSLGITFGKSGG
jgi:hypothetical protein